MSDFPLWYIPLAVYFAGSTASGLLQRQLTLTSTVPLRLITAILYLCFLMPVGIILALVQRDLWINWQPITAALLMIQAIGIAGFFAFAFQLNKHVDATQYVIIGNMYTLVTVLLGVFVIHEAFTAQQFLGTLLLIVGAILVALRGVGRRAWHFDKHSIWLAVLSIGLGVGLAAERGALNYMSYSTYALLGWGLQTLLLCLFAFKDWGAFPKITRSQWRKISELGFARIFHNVGFFLSVVLSRNVALIASVASFRVPLVYIASYILLKERQHALRRFSGVAIATAGLFLL